MTIYLEANDNVTKLARERAIFHIYEAMKQLDLSSHLDGKTSVLETVLNELEDMTFEQDDAEDDMSYVRPIIL